MNRKPPSLKRKWFQCNIPIFLDVIVVAYFFFTYVCLSDSSLLSRNSHASVHLFRKSKPIPVGNAFGDWGLMFIPSSQFFAFIHTIPDMVTALFLGSMTLIALHMGALSDPGEVPHYWGPPIHHQENNNNNSENNINENSNEENSNLIMNEDYSVMFPNGGFNPKEHIHPDNVPGWTICDKCEIWRPPRAYHCRECGACVARNDHHCVWFANHVGATNHKCFFLFLLYISSSISHFWLMLLRFPMADSVSQWIRKSETVGVMLFLFVYTIVVLSTTFFAFIFFCSTTWSMLVDETTIEEMIRRKPRANTNNKQKQQQFQQEQQTESLWGGDDPKDINGKPTTLMGKLPKCIRFPIVLCKRSFNNCKVVLGPNPLMWLIPTLIPLENPLPKHSSIRRPGDFV